MFHIRFYIISLFALFVFSSVQAVAGINISMDASPMSIPADGKSCSQVLVTILDQNGLPVSDNTEVRLTTSAGDITPIVYTSGGRATGILTSSTCPQIAVINAMAEGISGSTQVEFSSSDQEASASGGKIIRMTAGSLVYCTDKDTVIGSSRVEIEYRDLTIRATDGQVCQTSGQIRAQGNVTVLNGERSLSADAIVCDIRSSRISLLDYDSPSEVKSFDIEKFRPVQDKKSQDFAPMVGADSKTWIASERLVIIPGDKILFFKASIYVGESKVIKMPYYAYNYDKRESILQQVRYTSNDGILVDLPFYYQMDDSKTSALKFRFAANGSESGGYTRPRKGLSLGLEHDYSINGSSQGTMFVDAVGSASQAFELAHHMDFGSMLTGGRADLSVRYQPKSSYAKNLYNATLNINGSLPNYNYSFSGYFGGSTIEQYDYYHQSNCNLKTVIRPKTPITSEILGKVSPSLTIGYGNLWSSSGTSTSSQLYQSIAAGFSRSRPGNGTTVVSYDGKTSLTMTANRDLGAGLRIGPTLRRSWLGGSGSVGYTYNLQSGTTESISALAKHQIGCFLRFSNSSKWSTNLSCDYGLDSGRMNLSSQFNYRIMKSWQMRSSYSLYKYSYTISNTQYHYETTYLKAGIYHPIGAYEVGLAWSPDGRNYGTDKSKYVWLEFSGSRL